LSRFTTIYLNAKFYFSTVDKYIILDTYTYYLDRICLVHYL